MQKSFGELLVEGVCVATLVFFGFFLVFGLGAGKHTVVDVIGKSAMVGLFCGVLLGFMYAGVRHLFHIADQRREVVLPCDYETACALCLTAFDKFPNHRLLQSGPGTYEALVNNNPIFSKLGSDLTPRKYGWVERVKLTVIPGEGHETTIKIEAHADLNRAFQIAVERKPHNADVIRAHLERNCDRPLPT